MPTKIRTRTTTQGSGRRLMLHACPRCYGDLFHDDYEDEYVCLQCGARHAPRAIEAQRADAAPIAA